MSVVELASPQTDNLLTRETMLDLAEVLATTGSTPAVLTAHGTAFSIGAGPATPDVAARSALVELFAIIDRRSANSVAAVDGVATGWGFALALAFPAVLAGPSAAFSMGMLVEDQVAANRLLFMLLARRVSHQRLLRLAYANAVVDAHEAFELGIIDGFVDHSDLLLARAAALAKTPRG